MGRSIEHEKAILEYENEIVYFTYKNGVYLDLETATSLKHHYLDFIENEKELLLADTRNLTGISKEAREFLGGEMGIKGIKSAAIMTNSPLSKTIANFFLLINKPKVPTKMFTNKKEAVKWLKS
jgi:hypothetical protein